MKRKMITASLAVFFICMVAATIIGENIYYDSLPVVETANLSGGTLAQTFYPTGRIVFEKQENVYHSLLDSSAVEFLVKDGENVKRGDPVFCIGQDEAAKAGKQTELALLKKENENEKISADGKLKNISEEDRLTYEINEIDIARYEEELVVLKKLEEDGGVTFASQEGRFRSIPGEGSRIAKGQALAVIASDTGHRELEWTMPSAEGILFGIGSTVEIETEVFETVDEETTIEKKILKLSVTEITFVPESQTYKFKADFPSEIKPNAQDNKSTMIFCKYVSEEIYGFVIPTEAVSIVAEWDTVGYVYLVKTRNRVYGEEYYVVETEVKIQRTVGEQTALVSAFNRMDYVISSSKDLKNDMAVRIK